MAELILVRHGQASLGSENYDRLSALGYQQARWLGEYFRERDLQFDRMVSGEMARHRQTADGICEGLGSRPAQAIHAGFNEFDFKGLAQAYIGQNPGQAIADWGDPRQFFGLLRGAMLAWSRDEIPLNGVLETWQAFSERVAAALEFARQGGDERVLVVSSGGAISMSLSQVMGFDSKTLIDLNLQSKNTGISQFYFNSRRLYVTSFNHVPHLDMPGRRDAITHS